MAAAKADLVESRLRLLTGSTADDNGFKRAPDFVELYPFELNMFWTVIVM